MWILLRKRYFILSLLVLIIGWNHIHKHFKFNGTDETPEHEYSVKILSYNVKNLANSNYHVENMELRSNIFHFLKKESPAILCLQEFFVTGNDTGVIIENLKKNINLPNVYCKNYRHGQKMIDALVIFTSLQIIQKGTISIEDKRIFAIYTNLLMDKDTVRLYNVHLESIRFRDEDYQFVTELASHPPADQKTMKERSINIINKLGKAFRKRSRQAKALAYHINNSPYPVIICGDFNDTPSSYAYHTASANLNDAFMISGKGYGNTYAGKLPPLRIDYILLDPLFESYSFTTHNVIRLSDHYPISCNITVISDQ